MARLTVARLLADHALFKSLLVRDGECMRWSLKKDPDGYGRFASTHVHRIAYQAFTGPIPKGLTVDHTCFVRDCCNPAHLRLLSHEENCGSRRDVLSDTCGAGHPRTAANVYVTKIRDREMRFCRVCNRQRVREYKARKTNRGEQRT